MDGQHLCFIIVVVIIIIIIIVVVVIIIVVLIAQCIVSAKTDHQCLFVD